MRMDGNGNLLVGTTSQIISSFTSIRKDANSLNPLVAIQNANAGSSARSVYYTQSDTASGQFGTVSSTWSGDTNIPVNHTYVYGSTGLTLYSGGSAHMAFLTNSAERMRISSTGNVGIGTIAPSARLDVAGDIEVNSNVNLNSEASILATVTKSQIASFAVASFRSGKLIVQAYDSVTGEVQISELLVAHNGTTASSTEYGVVYTGANPLVVFDVDISAGNVRLMATRTTTNSTQYKVSETLMVA
jgi:hypothetical protein